MSSYSDHAPWSNSAIPPGRPAFGPDREVYPAIDPTTDLPAGVVTSAATVRGWSELVDGAHERIAEYRSGPADAGQDRLAMVHEIADRIDDIRGIDPDIASELELEWLDVNAGPAATWGAEWDEACWECNGPASGDDLGLADPADAAGDDLVEPAGLLTLTDWVESVALAFRGIGTEAGALVADVIRDLAAEIRATGARTPAQARDCMSVLAYR